MARIQQTQINTQMLEVIVRYVPLLYLQRVGVFCPLEVIALLGVLAGLDILISFLYNTVQFTSISNTTILDRSWTNNKFFCRAQQIFASEMQRLWDCFGAQLVTKHGSRVATGHEN